MQVLSNMICRYSASAGFPSGSMDYSYRVAQPEAAAVEQSGVAAKLMAKMGYQKGTGLGLCSENLCCMTDELLLSCNIIHLYQLSAICDSAYKCVYTRPCKLMDSSSTYLY